jgi:hypothetical protein
MFDRQSLLRFFVSGLIASLLTTPSHAATEAVAAAEFETRGITPVFEPKDFSANAWHKRWAISIAPLLASQALDAASSYGMRELNPVLAGPDGTFGVKATAVKFGIVGGLIGVECVVVKQFPKSAKFFTVLNWTTAGVTTGLAIHNYRLPGR